MFGNIYDEHEVPVHTLLLYAVNFKIQLYLTKLHHMLESWLWLVCRHIYKLYLVCSDPCARTVSVAYLKTCLHLRKYEDSLYTLHLSSQIRWLAWVTLVARQPFRLSSYSEYCIIMPGDKIHVK